MATKSLPTGAYEHRNARELMVYPNPFSDDVVFKFRFNETMKGSLEIFSFVGEPVKVYDFKNQSAGDYQVVWDGKDSQGHDLPKGIYFYTYKAQGNNDQSLTNGRILKK